MCLAGSGTIDERTTYTGLVAAGRDTTAYGLADVKSKSGTFRSHLTMRSRARAVSVRK